MGTRICSKCRKEKPLMEFGLRSGGKYLRSHCKQCERVTSEEYYKSKNGLPSKIYGNQIKSSNRRGHHNPEYNMSELRDWIKSQPNFNIIYDKWVQSGYKKELIPSVDRIDDSKGYSFDNIRITTWRENQKKAYKGIKDGSVTTNQTPVIQFDKQGNRIGVYASMHDAHRKTGVHFSCIHDCCKGRNKTAGGFIWEKLKEVS